MGDLYPEGGTGLEPHPEEDRIEGPTQELQRQIQAEYAAEIANGDDCARLCRLLLPLVVITAVSWSWTPWLAIATLCASLGLQWLLSIVAAWRAYSWWARKRLLYRAAKAGLRVYDPADR